MVAHFRIDPSRGGWLVPLKLTYIDVVVCIMFAAEHARMEKDHKR